MKLSRATVLMFNDGKLLMIHRLKDGKEYHVLPGGNIEEDETMEEATIRELKEETSLVSNIKEKLLEFTDPFERNHQIFLCEYVPGEVKFEPNSVEVLDSRPDNTYVPIWVNIKDIPTFNIWPAETKPFLMEYFKDKMSLK